MPHPLRALRLLALACLALPLPSLRAEQARILLPMTDDGLPGTGPIRRADWFQRLWTERREAFARDQQKDQGALVFLGDSITQGWWDVGSFFPSTRIANRGISGDTTRGVLVRLQEDVLSLRPRAIVLLLGTNDLEDNSPPEIVAANMKLILDAFQAHNPKMPVVLLQVLPSSPTMRRPADRIKKLNTLYLELAASHPQVSVLDTWSLLADVQGNAKLEDMPDLLHPNQVGYAKLAAALRPMLESLGLVPVWPDDFSPEPGFTSLFNGRDLSGWSYADGRALTGQAATPDGRYFAKDGRLVVPVSHADRAYKKLWTTTQFPRDFTLRLEFRATPNADSGIYIREPQLQCRDFSVIGPFTQLKNYRTCEWNEIEIIVKDGLAHATCNGEVLVDALEVPADGPLGLESDRGQIEYRRIRIKTP